VGPGGRKSLDFCDRGSLVIGYCFLRGPIKLEARSDMVVRGKVRGSKHLAHWARVLGWVIQGERIEKK